MKTCFVANLPSFLENFKFCKSDVYFQSWGLKYQVYQFFCISLYVHYYCVMFVCCAEDAKKQTSRMVTLWPLFMNLLYICIHGCCWCCRQWQKKEAHIIKMYIYLCIPPTTTTTNILCIYLCVCLCWYME